MKKVAIIGGGISGLVLAYELKKKLIPVVIFEKENHFGGWIDTEQDQFGLWEKGPRALRSKGEGRLLLKLAYELGLEKEIIASDDRSKVRYYRRDGKLSRFPSITDAITSPSFSWNITLILRAIWRDLTTPPLKRDVTAWEFFRIRLGEWAIDWVKLICKGIYACDGEKLSAESIFKELFNGQIKYGSITLFLIIQSLKNLFNREKHPLKSALFSFKGGLKTLVSALTSQLPQEQYLGYELFSITRESGKYSLEFALKDQSKKKMTGFSDIVFAGSLISCREVVHTYLLEKRRLTPSWIAFNNFSMKRYGLYVLSFFIEGAQLDKRGFGFLSYENEDLLGMVWDSSIFPAHSHSKGVRVTCMYSSSSKPCHLEEWIEKASKEVKKVLKPQNDPIIFSSPSFIDASQSMVHFDVGFAEIKNKALKELSSISVYATGFDLASRGVSGALSDAIALSEDIVDNKIFRKR